MTELSEGHLVPLFPALGAIRFAAYWMICPRRHLQRQPVRSFRDWLQTTAREHEQQKDQLLDALGCTRHPVPGPTPSP